MASLLKRILGIWEYAVAIIFAAIFVFPLIWMIYSSFKLPREIIRTIWALPSVINLNGYAQVFTSSSFGTYYANSIIMVLLNVPLLTIVAAMAAYAGCIFPPSSLRHCNKICCAAQPLRPCMLGVYPCIT